MELLPPKVKSDDLPPCSAYSGELRFWSSTSAMDPLKEGRLPAKIHPMSEIIFEVREDEVDGGFHAAALGYGIHTQGDTLEELRAMVRDAVDCYFDGTQEAPRMIRLHFVRDEVLAR